MIHGSQTTIHVCWEPMTRESNNMFTFTIGEQDSNWSLHNKVAKDTCHRLSERHQQTNISIPLSSICGIFLFLLFFLDHSCWWTQIRVMIFCRNILLTLTYLITHRHLTIWQSLKVIVKKYIECRFGCYIIWYNVNCLENFWSTFLS